MKTALPRQVKLLTLCYALMLCGTSMIVLTAGLIGQSLAANPALATMPVALMVVGVAINTIPLSWLMSRYGRRPVFIGYALLTVAAALLAALSLWLQSFHLFCLAAALIGASAGSAQQYRFVAMESVEPEQMPKAASTILIGGILAAIIGPELSVWGKDILAEAYVGSFLLVAMVNGLGFILLLQVKPPALPIAQDSHSRRPLRQILSNPTLILAITAAALAYAVMSFIMTATPLSMHHHYGHSLNDTKWVIQAHVAAMYLPSLFSGKWTARFGHQRMMVLGLLAFAACLVLAYSSHGFWAFTIALILLGVGWNFLFVAGTALLPQGYRPEEKFKVQGINDFLVFGTQAMAALSSGWLLLQLDWPGIVLLSVLPIAGFCLLLFSHSRLLSAQKQPLPETLPEKG